MIPIGTIGHQKVADGHHWWPMVASAAEGRSPNAFIVVYEQEYLVGDAGKQTYYSLAHLVFILMNSCW